MRRAIQLLRTPLGVGIVMTVALATAACTAVGALVDAALFRRPPFHEAERLAILYITRQGRSPGLERQRWSFRRFQLLQSAAIPALFSDLAAFTRTSTLTITGEGDPEPVEGEVVTGEYFRTLAQQPLVGRAFVPDPHDASLARAEVVLGYDVWQRRFGGDVGVLGRPLVINTVPFTIIGVMPQRFAGLTGRAELWITPGMAARISYRDYLTTNQNFISVVGRLAPGVTLARAAVALPSLGASIDRAAASARESADDRFGATVLSLNAARVDPREQQWMHLLAGAVMLLFLLACANVSNLLIARVIARRRELAIRSALGASRWDNARAILGEGATLVLAGGAAGAALAMAVLPSLDQPTRIIAPRNMYGSIGAFAVPAVDWRFAAFAIGVSVVAALLCSALPALLPQRLDLTRDLKDGAPNASLTLSARGLTPRSLMVVLETAMALMLLVAGGLMMESFRRLRAAPLGFTPNELLTFWIRPSEVEYPPWRAPSLIARVLYEIEQVPGVVAATVDGCTPVSTGCANTTLYVIGRAIPRPEDAPLVLRHYVAAEHFATLRVPLLRGRVFTAQDRAGTARVAIINQLAADRFFPGEDPIGKRVWFGGGSNFDRPDSAAEIVGVVGNVAYQSLDERPIQPDFYTPYAQFTYASRAVLVRTSGDPAALVPTIRRAVARADASLALYEVRTMEERLGDSLAARRFDTQLLAVFAVVALVLAGMGIYAVVANSVAQRTREVGIRVALGATPDAVIAMVVREGMRVPAIGLVVGVAGALATTRLLRAALYGVSATSLAPYVVLTALLALVAAIACYLPARRAGAVDPVTALKT
jgi:putative ABC transport system permease protein